MSTTVLLDGTLVVLVTLVTTSVVSSVVVVVASVVVVVVVVVPLVIDVGTINTHVQMYIQRIECTVRIKIL